MRLAEKRLTVLYVVFLLLQVRISIMTFFESFLIAWSLTNCKDVQLANADALKGLISIGSKSSKGISLTLLNGDVFSSVIVIMFVTKLVINP